LGTYGIYGKIVGIAEEYDWDVKGGVTPHWCRHWFTTQLRAHINDEEVAIGSAKEYVQGLRGDSDDSVIGTYTHEWDIDDGTKSYPKVYRENIPTLLSDPHDDGEITCSSCGREPPTVTFSTVGSVDGTDSDGKLCNTCARREYVSLD